MVSVKGDGVRLARRIAISPSASLGTTVNHYNSAHKELAKVDKDVVKIAERDPSVEPLLIDKPTNDTE